MSNKILAVLLFASPLLVISVYFIYRGFGWPFGREGLEAFVAFGVFLVSFILFSLFLYKHPKSTQLQKNSVTVGLLAGLLWTLEICMNNILRPGLPARDIYDNVFWAAIAIEILFFSVVSTFKTSKFNDGVKTGFWAGFASGAVAGITALTFIVFGMNFLLLDQLNVSEWAVRGVTSGTPNIRVYFAYQSLAGGVMHLIILGIVMGVLLGVAGGFLGKIVTKIVNKQ